MNNPSPPTLESLLAAGANDFLPKPLEVAEVAARIVKLIGPVNTSVTPDTGTRVVPKSSDGPPVEEEVEAGQVTPSAELATPAQSEERATPAALPEGESSVTPGGVVGADQIIPSSDFDR